MKNWFEKFVEANLAKILVPILTPLILAGVALIAKYAPDQAAKVDAGMIAAWVSSVLTTVFVGILAHRYSKTKSGVKIMQEAINGSTVEVKIAVDGRAVPEGETVAALNRVVRVANSGVTISREDYEKLYPPETRRPLP